MPRRVAFLKGEFHPDRDSMNAYVVMGTDAEATAALAFNGQQIGGKTVRVDLAGAAKAHDESRSVFLGSLPFAATEDDVRRHFRDCGAITSVRLVRDAKTNLGKGFGFVLFEVRVVCERSSGEM